MPVTLLCLSHFHYRKLNSVSSMTRKTHKLAEPEEKNTGKKKSHSPLVINNTLINTTL